MKLFLFGLFKPQEPQQSFRDALRGICDEYREHSWVDDIPNARKDFHRIMAEFKPDVVFMQLQEGDIIKASTLVRYPNVKFFNFSGDVRHIFPPWHFEIAPYCTTLFTNTEWVSIMTGRGFRARYFQIGFDENIYKPDGPKAETAPVVFMGNNHGTNFELSPLRNEMIKRFSSKPWFKFYGRGFPGAIDMNYRQQEEAAIYRGAKIGINLSHMDLDCYTSDRMFRIMGCGTLCLAYKHKGIEKEFSDSGDVVIWQTLADLDELIDYYASENSPMGNYNRSRIALKGCKLVHSKYTWAARLQQDLIPLL